MKKKTKYKIMLVLLYFVILGIAFVLIPTIFQTVINPLSNSGYVSDGSLHLADWSIIGAQQIVACGFLWFAFTIAYLFSMTSGSWKNNRGDEYGSARLMSDDEFDTILPNYIFEKDEQEINGPISKNPPERVDESDKVVFDYFEYEEVKSYE